MKSMLGFLLTADYYCSKNYIKGNKQNISKDLGQFPIQSAQILTECGLDNA